METLFDADFWPNTLIGLLGLVLWILCTWANPADDTLTGTLRSAVRGHSRSLVLALVSYFTAAVVFHELGEWTLVAAITAGYTGQSLVTKALQARAAKMGGP